MGKDIVSWGLIYDGNNEEKKAVVVVVSNKAYLFGC